MEITPDQLNQLRQDLIDLANITYEEVMDEILDHYASLTEEQMREGQPFEEASHKALIKLGSGQGILHIQERYEKLLTKQIQMQHLTIIRYYFRWPTIITTLLIGILTYLFAQFLSAQLIWIIFLVFAFAPYLLFIPSEVKFIWRKRIKKEVVLESLKRYVVYRQARYGNYLYLAIVQLPVLIVSFITNDSRYANRPFFFEWHAGLSVALTFVAAVYALTFFDLYVKHSPQRSANF